MNNYDVVKTEILYGILVGCATARGGLGNERTNVSLTVYPICPRDKYRKSSLSCISEPGRRVGRYTKWWRKSRPAPASTTRRRSIARRFPLLWLRVVCSAAGYVWAPPRRSVSEACRTPRSSQTVACRGSSQRSGNSCKVEPSQSPCHLTDLFFLILFAAVTGGNGPVLSSLN